MSGMNDERLQDLLGQLRNERMDHVADDKIRARLENAWTMRVERRGFGAQLRRWAPALATVVLLLGLGGATMNASGDSALYGIRIAVENAAVALHTDPEDRNEYLLSLLEQRQDEAARLESIGNALAASKVREVEQSTLKQLMADLPQAPDDDSSVQPAPTDTPAPAPSATATPSPTPSPTAVRTATPTDVAHTPTPTTRPTTTPAPTVRTTAPTPAPTGSPFAVTIMGLLKNPDGTPAANVCIFQSTTSAPGTNCLTATRSDGTYQLTVSARLYQIVAIYFYGTDGTVAYKATASKMVTGPTVTMPVTYLQK